MKSATFHIQERCPELRKTVAKMKNYQNIKLFTLILLVFFSCNKKESSGFNYNIIGTVKDSTSNGIEISLVIPSKGLEKRSKAKIVNGKFEFNGYIEKPEFAEIQFEYDILNNSGNQFYIPIIIEPLNTKLSLEITESTAGTFKEINELKFLSGVNNKIFYEELSFLF